MTNPILFHVPVSAGELLDKITILEIKRARIADDTKRANVCRELTLLEDVARTSIPSAPELTEWTAALRATNEQLWDIEDAIRHCEREHDFGPDFIRLARAVYTTNDHRADLKRRINEHLGSALVEEKSYS